MAGLDDESLSGLMRGQLGLVIAPSPMNLCCGEHVMVYRPRMVLPFRQNGEGAPFECAPVVCQVCGLGVLHTTACFDDLERVVWQASMAAMANELFGGESLPLPAKFGKFCLLCNREGTLLTVPTARANVKVTAAVQSPDDAGPESSDAEQGHLV